MQIEIELSKLGSELHKIMNDRDMKEAIILVLANKQDLPDGKWCNQDFVIFGDTSHFC